MVAATLYGLLLAVVEHPAEVVVKGLKDLPQKLFEQSWPFQPFCSLPLRHCMVACYNSRHIHELFPLFCDLTMVNAREAIFSPSSPSLLRRTRMQGTITGAGGAGGARHPTPGTPSEPRAWIDLIFSLAALCLCPGQVKLRAGAPFLAATAFVQCGLQPLKCSIFQAWPVALKS